MLIDIQAIKTLGRQLGRALSDAESTSLAAALEKADMARRLRKAANAGRNTRLKRLTAVRKGAEKLAIALDIDDDARADLDILTPQDALSCKALASQLRRLAGLASARAAQVRGMDGDPLARARDEAIRDLAVIAKQHLGLDLAAPSQVQRALFADFVGSVFKLWGLGPLRNETILMALGVGSVPPP